MIWVGLTGGIASGKSTAADLLRGQGLAVVDADELARRVVEPGTAGASRLRALVGPQYFTRTGELKRADLAKLIFSDSTARAQVENILHPLIQIEMEKHKESLLKQGKDLAFYDVPLLFEKKLQSRFDATLLIYAPEEVQTARLKLREGWSAEEIESRLAAQLPMDQKKSLADYVIDNSGTVDDLKKNLSKMVDQIKVDLRK